MAQMHWQRNFCVTSSECPDFCLHAFATTLVKLNLCEDFRSIIDLERLIFTNMYLDKIYSLQTGVSLEISTITLSDLIEDVADGRRIPELEKIRAPADLYNYLSVIVHADAEGLIKRRHTWVDKIKDNLLAGQAVSYSNFEKLFWRSLDEEDPDGDEWYQLTASERFHSQLIGLLDMLRTVERRLYWRDVSYVSPDLEF